MSRLFCLFFILMAIVPSGTLHAESAPDASAAEAEADKEPDQSTGLPLPRYASLKSDNVYVRTGPSMDYPIKWIYKKEGLPVEIIQEFDAWRKIKDPAGDIGWAHKILLSGKKTALITAEKSATAYDDEEMERPVVRFEKGIIVNIEECQKLMCRVHFAPYKGWIEKKYLWGVYGSDIFN